VELGAWIVMPNHIHGIVNMIENEVDWEKRIPNANEQSEQSLEQFASPVAGSIATIIRSFKSSVTQHYQNLYNDYSTKLWQRNYYDHIIRSETDLKNIYDYIVDNPRKWMEDENYSP
jgi:REP element-mobilizing transposase RayT